MANRFRNPFLRDTYDSMVDAYREKRSLLFQNDGSPSRGNSWACDFWNGYDRRPGGPIWDRASRQTGAYAVWCAGLDMGRKDKT